MTSSSALLLVLTSLFSGAALASLADSAFSKRAGVRNQKRSSIRLTLFFLFLSVTVITATCLVIFTSFMLEYSAYSTSDYVYILVFFCAGFLSTLWYKTILPFFVSLYVIIFLAFSFYLDSTCLSYESPVVITFEKNSVTQGEKPIPLVHSTNSTESLLNTGYLVIQEYTLPTKLLLPLHKHYYRFIVFSQNRMIQDDFALDFFVPPQNLEKKPFLSTVTPVLKSLSSLISVEAEVQAPVFYYIEIELAEFYPYVFTLQPVKSTKGFSYILDKLI